MTLISELKRRNVFRVALLYAVSSWLILQVADVLFGLLTVPDWTLKFVFGLLLLGFPLVVIFSWVYEITPEGVKLEKDIDRSESVTAHTGRKFDAAILAGIVLIAAMLLIEQLGERDESARPAQPAVVTVDENPPPPGKPEAEPKADARTSVAVLPFVNMSPDPDNEFFSDGISEELLNVLVQVRGLRVPSRTSSFSFKGQNVPIRQIAEQLEVDHVLEGSVRQSGNQVRITAQLIQASTDEHLWSETYTRTLDDIFVVQDEIANAIVSALQVTLGTQSINSRVTDNVEAYRHYLKGRYFWHQRNLADAEQYLLLATGEDPEFARAWAALAETYVLFPEYGVEPVKSASAKARRAIEYALALNPDSAQALIARAWDSFLYQWQYEQAEADFLRAIELDPEYATTWQWYAEYLAAMRRFDEAIEMHHRSLELDPLSPSSNLVLANTLRILGRFDEAIAQYETTLEIKPGYEKALRGYAELLRKQGQYAQAQAMWARTQSAVDGDPNAYGAVAAAQAGTISVSDAVALITDRHVNMSGKTGGCAVGSALPLALLEAYERAIDLLEQCLDDDPYAPMINIPDFDPMRDMPRFQALLRKVNLPLALP